MRSVGISRLKECHPVGGINRERRVLFQYIKFVVTCRRKECLRVQLDVLGSVLRPDS